MASKDESPSLTLNKRLEIIKLITLFYTKNRDRLKSRPLVPVNQAVNTKEMFLKEIKLAAPVNTQMILKQIAPLLIWRTY